MFQGKLLSIHVSDAAGAPMRRAEHARVVPGKGIEGDRYFDERGFYSWFKGPLREISLIEHEAVEAAKADFKLELPEGATRRNLLTQGVPLTHLVGRRFRVGEVLLYGVEIATPCQHLVEVSGVPKLLKALLHRAGLHAQVVTEGVIRPGDVIESVDA